MTAASPLATPESAPRTATHSLATTLDHLAPHFPERLISPGARARLEALGARLPAALSACTYLERRLRAHSERVDLILRIDPARRGILAAGLHGLSLGTSFRSRDAWRRVEALARAWEAPSSLLHRGVEAFWLEFDLEPEAPVVPAPRVFLDFARDVYEQATVSERGAVARAALSPLLGAELRAELDQQILRCMGALPSGAFLLYVGTGPGAPSVRVRLCVLGLADGEILPFLRRVSWPGDLDHLAGTVLQPLARARCAPGRSVAILHLDLGPRVLPRVGLEYAFDRRSQLAGRVVEAGFLDHLVEQGLCDPAERNALLCWPGRSVELLAHEIWYSQVVRRLSHVKVVYRSGRPLEVKAYLCFFHELLRGHPRPGEIREPHLQGDHARVQQRPGSME